MKLKKRINILEVNKKFHEAIDKEQDKKEIVKLLEEFGKDLSSATNSAIWFCRDDSFYSMSNDLKISKQKSIINESWNLKLPMLFNGAEEHQSYNKELDNPKNLELKDLLYYPIINREERVVAIFKSIITSDYIHQFIHKDIENLQEFILFALKIIEERVNLKDNKKDILQESSKDKLKLLEDNSTLNQQVESLILQNNRLRARENYFVELVHNLRLPINSILGYSDFIDAKLKNSNEYCESVKNIIDSSYYIQQTIDSVLSFSKIDSEILEVKNREFSLLEMYEYLVDMLISYTNKKGIFFNTFYDTNIPTTFISDKEKLQQAIISLMKNAIDRTPAFGKIDFEINYDKKNSLINFSVVDSGEEITQEEQNGLFIEKYGVKSSGIVKNNKIQIRLPFVKKVLLLLGSDIKIDSTDETKFSFAMSIKNSDKDADSMFDMSILKDLKVGLFLPDISHIKEMKELLLKYLKNFGIENIVEFEENDKIEGITHLFCLNTLIEDEKLQELIKNGIKVTLVVKKLSSFESNKEINQLCIPFKATKIYDILANFKIKKRNVLVIDDNIETLNHLKNKLKRVGATVTTGSSGKDAVDIFVDFVISENRIDMIFIDEDMSNTDGIKASKEILELSRKYGIEKIPIIITTNKTDKKEIKAIKSIGIDFVIQKPISYDKIRKIYNK